VRIAELTTRFARQFNLFAAADYVRPSAARRTGGPHVASASAMVVADVVADDDWRRFVDANDEWADSGD
jgi:hypothetical protein